MVASTVSAGRILSGLIVGIFALAVIFLDRPWNQSRPAEDGLRTTTVTREGLEVKIAATGAFQLLEYVDIGGAQLSGQLKAVTVGLGDVVRRGQPNGVVFETGEFIHLRSYGITQAGPGVQAKAVDEVRITLSGTPLREAHHVNRLGLG